eukprot:1178238-Amphidinium_carterae.2
MGSSGGGGVRNSSMGSRKCMGGHVEEDAVGHWPGTGSLQRHLWVCGCVHVSGAMEGGGGKRGHAAAKGGPPIAPIAVLRMHWAVPKCHAQQESVQCLLGDKPVVLVRV